MCLGSCCLTAGYSLQRFTTGIQHVERPSTILVSRGVGPATLTSRQAKQ